MGHAFPQTLMDLMVRYQPMPGADALCQCGIDQARIATQKRALNQPTPNSLTKCTPRGS